MCGGQTSAEPGATGLTRRRFLAGAAAAGALVIWRSPRGAASGFPTVDLGGVAVIPRSAWGGDLAPKATIAAEPDVRYLLVHHSVDPGNDYGEDTVAGILRGFVGFHSSAAKGWPDLAYNFLVDRFGRVWEGRTGSLAGPVAGDATGGNQGFDQLCCFIGNHQVAEPTPAAFAAMGHLLGAVARRSAVPLGDGSTATFTSRGSNRHPAGASVMTPTITGHRDMSQTQCPGDKVAARLPELRLLAAAGAASARATTTTNPAPPTTTTNPAPPTTGPPTTAPTPVAPAGSTTTSAAETTTAPSAPTQPPATGGGNAAGRTAGDGNGSALGPEVVVAAGALATATVGVAAWARANGRPPPR